MIILHNDDTLLSHCERYLIIPPTPPNKFYNHLILSRINFICGRIKCDIIEVKDYNLVIEIILIFFMAILSAEVIR